MGYIYEKITSTTFDNFLVELEEKTGIAVKKTDSTTSDSSGYNNLTIQFPGKEEVRGANLYYSSSTSRVFADIDNELLILKIPDSETSIYKGDVYVHFVFYNAIRIYNGNFQSVISSVSQDRIRDVFNISSTPKNDSTLNSIVIYPAYYGNNSVQIKNLYLNSQRAFLCGLVLEDDNGDRYFTLGSYFLYKIN